MFDRSDCWNILHFLFIDVRFKWGIINANVCRHLILAVKCMYPSPSLCLFPGSSDMLLSGIALAPPDGHLSSDLTLALRSIVNKCSNMGRKTLTMLHRHLVPIWQIQCKLLWGNGAFHIWWLHAPEHLVSRQIDKMLLPCLGDFDYRNNNLKRITHHKVISTLLWCSGISKL